MSHIIIRQANRSDLPRLTEIYNHYVVRTPVTFDVTPFTVEQRENWFTQFGSCGRYRLLVAEHQDQVVAYAGSTRFRPKPAYDTTVETTVYCAPEATGCGIGSQLYAELFRSLAGEDIHRFVGVYALPNPATAALHVKFGFTLVGVFSEAGRKLGRYWDIAWVQRNAE
jgi:phosphinothricin acetyltransferase